MSSNSDRLLKRLLKEVGQKTRISSQIMKEIWFETFSISEISDENDFSQLLELLKELESEKKIKLPSEKGSSWDHTMSPSFPKWIAIIHPTETKNKELLSYPWHPRLDFVPSLSISSNAINDLKMIDEFLKRNQSEDISTISLRERSIEIFNDEKKLEKLLKRSWFKNNISSDLLKITINPEPFGVKSFCSAQTTHAIILENIDTFTAFLNANKKLKKPFFRYIIYGKGHLIEKTIFWIKNLEPLPGLVYYFGDIDRRGFSIPYRILKIFKEENPTIKFKLALPFYEALIINYKEVNNIEVDLDRVVCKEYRTLEDLPDSMRRFINYLYLNNLRIPQEFLVEEQIMEIIMIKL